MNTPFTTGSIEYRDPQGLEPHELNAKLYGEAYDADRDRELKYSIAESGIHTPLIITADGTIISGHRRCGVAKDLGMSEVPVIVSPLTDALDIQCAVIDANVHREKTVEIIAREYRQLKSIEADLAAKRMKAGGKVRKGSKKGRASEIAINMLGQGQSSKYYDAAVKVIEAIETYEKEEDSALRERAETLRKRLNKAPFGAYRYAIRQGWISASSDAEKKSRRLPFNRTNSSVDWAGWTWSPITGCEMGCQYCYAREMASNPLMKNSFPHGFTPHFYPERLEIPDNPKPHKGSTDIRSRSVFVCSMGELFANKRPMGAPKDYLAQILACVRKAPRWNFLFLSKNPEQLVDIDWPDNAWVGTTVDRQARVAAAEAAFEKVNAKVKFLSCEPLLEELTFSRLDLFDWLIIGGRTVTKECPASEEYPEQPKYEWVLSLMAQAEAAGCKVYCKPNLRPEWPKTSPIELTEEELAKEQAEEEAAAAARRECAKKPLSERAPWLSNLADEAAQLTTTAGPAVYTVGYEDIEAVDFFTNLVTFGIKRIVDVRDNPVSRKFGYSKGTMAKICDELGIECVSMPSMGVPKEWRDEAKATGDFQAAFDRFEQELLPCLQAEVEAIAVMMQEAPTAIMCFEHYTTDCHRHRIARKIAEDTDLRIIDLRETWEQP